jgi:hypothetical protein
MLFMTAQKKLSLENYLEKSAHYVITRELCSVENAPSGFVRIIFIMAALISLDQLKLSLFLIESQDLYKFLRRNLKLLQTPSSKEC